VDTEPNAETGRVGVGLEPVEQTPNAYRIAEAAPLGWRDDDGDRRPAIAPYR
jgi:hypothetical protein